MGQVSLSLRKNNAGFHHWCDGCKELHILPMYGGWTFNGNLDKPTFSPSFKHEGLRIETDEKTGKWTGEWLKDDQGKPIPYICHYVLTNGILNYCSDSTHEMAGKSVSLPPLPEAYKDYE